MICIYFLDMCVTNVYPDNISDYIALFKISIGAIIYLHVYILT